MVEDKLELMGKLVRGASVNYFTDANCIRISIEHNENGKTCKGIVACHLSDNVIVDKLNGIRDGDTITVIGKRKPNSDSPDETNGVLFVLLDCDIRGH